MKNSQKKKISDEKIPKILTARFSCVSACLRANVYTSTKFKNNFFEVSARLDLKQE